MVGDANAVAAARNFRWLRRRGITIRKTIDMLIGTWCIDNHVPLLHNDSDFRPMARHLGLVETRDSVKAEACRDRRRLRAQPLVGVDHGLPIGAGLEQPLSRQLLATCRSPSPGSVAAL
jgi:hypothetical protein